MAIGIAMIVEQVMKVKKNNSNETIRYEHFAWILYRRGDMYYADGRGNAPPLGRHSLGTNDPEDARKKLVELDRVMAIKRGLIGPSSHEENPADPLSLTDGRRMYEEHLKRPEVAGGPSAKTRKRYRAVLDKFIQFLDGCGVRSWNVIDRQVLEQYLKYLEDEGYEEATLYLEGTTIKQIIKFLVESGRLPESSHIRLKLRKPSDSSTFCYTLEQFQAMLDHCQKDSRLQWLRDAILGLGFTGLRVSELASLRWRDVDLSRGILDLTNDPASFAAAGGQRRRTKSRKDRSVPINDRLLAVLRSRPRHADGLIFRGPKGGKLDPDVLRIAFVDQVIEPLVSRFPSGSGEIGFKDGRLHSFRHFFCSWAANQGVPEPVLMSWLGHRDSAMVQRYYHLHESESRTYIERLKLADGTSGEVAQDAPAA